MGHLRYGDPTSFTPEGVEAMIEGNRERRREIARGIGPQDCTCGALFDEEFSLDREFWHEIHAEAARRRGDTAHHSLEPF